MPLYKYECKDCNNEFEALQKSYKDENPKCDKCDSENTVRQVGHSSFILKGGGWYKDGYTKNGNSTPTNAENTSNPILKTPIISDRKTGKQLGYGKSEIV